MKLNWLNNGFICKELYAPFKIDKDSDYQNDLEKKYKDVYKRQNNLYARNKQRVCCKI